MTLVKNMISDDDRKIIVFIGSAGSGKTTAANILQEKRFNKLSFASPIKKLSLSIGFTENEVYGSEKNKPNLYWGISAREFMQKFGTELCRDQLPNVIPNMNINGQSIWLRALEAKLLSRPRTNFVIDDGRFVDELKMLKRRKAYIVLMHGRSGSMEQFKNHASEREFERVNPDYNIDNSGTKEQLEMQIDTLLNIINYKSADKLNPPQSGKNNRIKNCLSTVVKTSLLMAVGLGSMYTSFTIFKKMINFNQ